MAEYFNDRLKETLVARGMTAAELARAIGVKNGYMSNLISGNISHPKKHMEAICKILRVRPQWILTGKGDPNLEIPDSELFDEVDLYEYEVDFKEKFYLGKIAVPNLKGEFSREIYAVSMPPDELAQNGLIVVVTPDGKGSGIFLLGYNNKLLLSTRFDSISKISWVHNTNEDVNIDQVIVIGKVVALFDTDT